MKNIKKSIFILLIALISLIILVYIFISPITKYLIEKYDLKYTGRQITMDHAFVNPLTGYMHFSDLKIYEANSDSIFFSANGLSLNFSVFKLVFSNTYEISELVLDHPRGIIAQNKEYFNFNDLIDKFSPKDTSANKKPVHFNILSIKVVDGEFHYREKLIPINYFIKKVNIESSGIQWNSDTVGAKFSFLAGIGKGDVKGNFNINIRNKDYMMAAIIHKYDLNIVGQYLKDLTNYGRFTANLDADFKSNGNFGNKGMATNNGMLAINAFHFGKNKNEDYLAFDKLVFAIKEISPQRHVYLFDSVSLTNPYFKYERYDYLDNIQTMFGKNGGKVSDINANPAKFNLVIEIANYIKIMSKNFFKSNYKIKRMAIYDGEIKYSDYSLSEKFSIQLDPLNFVADSIDKNQKRVGATFKSGIKPYGYVSAYISINPNDSSDFDLRYHLQKLPMSMFNPYTITYTSFSLDRGTLELQGNWNVRNGIIRSNNHVLIIDPRVTKRLRNKDRKWIPLPLVMSLIRERGNVIDYEIPITGNLKSPTFHWRDPIIDAVKNIFIKPATTPYRMDVKNIELEIEKSLTLKWQMNNPKLHNSQIKFIKRMANFLVENPEAMITVYPQHYSVKEKEYILFFEAKKKYFMSINNNSKVFSESDSIRVEKMSAKDSLFVQYIDKNINNSLVFTIQEKCSRFIGSDIVNTKYTQLNKNRINTFLSYFREFEVHKRVKVSMSQNVIPYNGFSFYKIKYKGEFPVELINAYTKMHKLNEKSPRDKFTKERKRIKN